MASVHSWIVACPSPDVYARLVPTVLLYPCVPHQNCVPSETMPRSARGTVLDAATALSTNPEVATLTMVEVSTPAVLYTTAATLPAPDVSGDPAAVA